MRAIRRNCQKRAAMVAAGSVLCALSLGTVAVGVASATMAQPVCTGTVIVDLDHSGHSYKSTVHQLGTTLTAGTYEAMAVELHSSHDDESDESDESDNSTSTTSETTVTTKGSGGYESYSVSETTMAQGDYSTSTTQAEASEQWEVRFLDSEGDVVGETTVMLSRDHNPVVELGSIVLDGSAVTVSLSEVKHYKTKDLGDARCLGLTRLPDPTTTTTAAPMTTTSTTVAIASTTTAAPTTTAKATTTTAAPQVAQAVRTTLPVTGSNSAALLAAGAASMMIGSALIMGGRRRQPGEVS
ncbi:MAG: LPXTG cell wall anchor domain-containing protein [Acidimicrobiales bacterium]